MKNRGLGAIKFVALGCLISFCVACTAPSVNGGADAPQATLPESASAVGPEVRELAVELSGPFEPAERFRVHYTAECMKAKGFSYDAAVPSGVDLLEAAGVPVIEDDVADKPHYKVLSGGEAEAESKPQETADYQAALIGPSGHGNVLQVSLGRSTAGMPKEGCQADGYTATYGSLENGILAGGLVVSELLKATAPAGRSAEFKDLNAEWQQCMGSRGSGNFESPGAAYMNVLDRKNPAESFLLPSNDKQCRSSTDYDNRAWAILDSYLASVVKPVESELLKIIAIRAAAKQS